MRQVRSAEPIPFSSEQRRALLAAVARELSWGLRATAHELRGWRSAAEAIPDACLRADALASLERKRGHAHGAALFTILPARREHGLLRLLVAFETLVDYLDNVSERHPDPADGEQLHRAVIDALDPDRPLGDYYARHPWREDGYLVGLVTLCRSECRALPAFERVRPLLATATRRALVLGINHDRDAERRDAALRAWAAPERERLPELAWFELSGAASATLAVHALLTLAAGPRLADAELAAVHAAYWPWISLATTMLDSYVDRAEDEAVGHHSYIAHYPDASTAAVRLRELLVRGLEEARQLPHGGAHTVIVACMAAMYLSKPSARAPQQRATTHELLDAAGPLVRTLLPVLRGWRIAYGQRSA